MYQPDTEILFPMRVAPQLRDLRGEAWQRLVDQATAAGDASPQQLAFTLLMIRQCGCLTCHPDAFRAMRGCTLCSIQAVRRFRGEDADLERLVQDAQDELMQRMAGPRTGLEPQLG
ncbi:MAG TPA: hypothetical protein VI410_11000 [Anaerolineales bacterium]|nr:hypothetical protein [Anaerolineales bacterium]